MTQTQCFILKLCRFLFHLGKKQNDCQICVTALSDFCTLMQIPFGSTTISKKKIKKKHFTHINTEWVFETVQIELWFNTHRFALCQGHLVGLLGQILSPNQQANLLWPIRAWLLPAAVDGFSDGQRHPKWNRLQVLQGETCTSDGGCDESFSSKITVQYNIHWLCCHWSGVIE